MEQDKTKILSDLYAIRATMSVVAQNDDEAQEEKRAIIALIEEQAHTNSAIRESENALGEKLYEKRNAVQEQLEELRNERNHKYRDFETCRQRAKRSILGYMGEELWKDKSSGKKKGVIFIILLVVSLSVIFQFSMVWSPSDYWRGVKYNSIACVVIVLIYLIWIFVSAFNERNDDKYVMTKLYAETQQLDSEIKKLKERYESYNECIKEETYSSQNNYQKKDTHKYYLAEIDGLIRSHENKVAECESRKAELEKQKEPHNEVIQAIAKKSQKIINTAVKTYPLIDFRDWENVDLLIYYFETGRADDMKEALQLVDRQRQTDQITRAIAMASKEICRTFDESMRRLGSALSQSFSVLSRQMAQQHVEMKAEMEQQLREQRAASERQIREIRAQTAEQRNAQAMNQALMEKISESSLHLAEQMDRQMEEVYGIY